MLDNLLRHKNKQKYICFDYETESLSLFYARPWQLSFIVCEGKEIKEEYDFFIDIEDLYVSPEAAKVTNFSWDKYNRLKKDKHEVLEKFESYLYNPEYINLGHNILRFDVYIHNTLRRICGKKPDYSYMERSIDTNCISKAIKLGIVKPKEDTMLQWQYRLANFYKRGVKTNLSQMLRDNNIDFDPKLMHNSLVDIRANFNLWNSLIYQVEI